MTLRMSDQVKSSLSVRESVAMRVGSGVLRRESTETQGSNQSALVTTLPPWKPLDAWKAIKATLRTQLGDREWEMWIRHARLWKVLSESTCDRCLVIEMPRNGQAIFGANRHLGTMRRLASRMLFGLVVTVEMDEHQLHTYRDHYGEPQFLEDRVSETKGEKHAQ